MAGALGSTSFLLHCACIAVFVASCVAETTVMTSPEERAARPRRLVLLLAIGADAEPRDTLATSRAWRAMGEELTTRGFDLVALATPRSCRADATQEELATAVEDELRGIDLAAYDELVLVTSPTGSCVWSTLLDRDVFAPGLDPGRVSLHVELVPAWPRSRVPRAALPDGETATCGAPLAMPDDPTRHLRIRLLGRSEGDAQSRTGPRPPASPAFPASRTLDVALDVRAFGRDLVLLIDEIFAARESTAMPALDLRRVTR